MATATAALTDAQLRALGTMVGHARCVGGPRTDEAGYVNRTAARALVDLGLARHEVSAMGADVYVLTAEGAAAAFTALDG